MKKEKKKTSEELQAERVRIIVKEIVVKKLNEDSKNVVARHLWDNHFRVNVWKDGKVDKSFFIVAKEDGIISSDSEIQ